MGVTAPPGALERLEEYAALLLEKNQVMNLTAITQPRDVARLHFLDSAAVLAYGGQRREGGSWLAGKSVIDVGTGAGFPGLVLKILEPSLRLTLLDSLGKRVDWLGEVCKALSLDGVDCLHARAEEQANISSFRDSFDVAVSRAVAALPALTELCLPFVRPGGVFLAMKSVGSDVEIAQAQNAVKRLGGKGLEVIDYPEAEYNSLFDSYMDYYTTDDTSEEDNAALLESGDKAVKEVLDEQLRVNFLFQNYNITLTKGEYLKQLQDYYDQNAMYLAYSLGIFSVDDMEDYYTRDEFISYFKSVKLGEHLVEISEWDEGPSEGE